MSDACLDGDGNENQIMQWKYSACILLRKKQAIATRMVNTLLTDSECCSLLHSPLVSSNLLFILSLLPSFLLSPVLFCFSFVESQLFGDSHREINFAWPLCLWKGTQAYINIHMRLFPILSLGTELVDELFLRLIMKRAYMHLYG